jgi:hypothetical protein
MKIITFLALIALPVWGIAAEDQGLRAVIDWSAWDGILRRHVVDGRVDYDSIADEPGFAATVNRIGSADLEGHDEASVLAFYINTYNVLAVQGILSGHSPKSGFGKLRFFFRDKYLVAGEKLSLNALEHKHIRPLGEPRIHFAIVCASASCPPLRSEAWVPGKLDAQLNDNARRFINDETKNRFDRTSGIAEISKIFKWFAEDFESSSESVQHYVAEFVEDDGVAEDLLQRTYKMRYLPYDWSLNGSSLVESHP